MKPRNAKEKEIIEISKSLPKLNDKQISYAYANSVVHKGFRTGKGTTCMECGHTFKTEKDKCSCPNCNVELEIEKRRTNKLKTIGYMSIFTVREEYQIIRHIQVTQYYQKYKPAIYDNFEVIRHFVTKEKTYVVSRLMLQYYQYTYQLFNLGSGLEIRNKSNVHYITSDCVYPYKKIHPIIKRNGFKGELHGFDSLSLFEEILRYNKAETLFKIKEYDFLSFCIYKSSSYYKYYKQILICHKHNYIVKDVSMWIDYIEMLKRFNKDVFNPYYICPVNLKESHDTLMNELNRIIERDKAIKDKQYAIEKEIRYKEGLKVLATKRNKYRNFILNKQGFTIIPLITINQYKEEGNALKHCVHSSHYWDRKESIILSARKNGVPIETIEFSLETGQVIQCHGCNNQDTEFHDKIINIVQRESNRILNANGHY